MAAGCLGACWRAARRAGGVAGLVLLYYGFSIGITFYNKWLMRSFSFPLFMTLLHLMVIFLLSGLARRGRGLGLGGGAKAGGGASLRGGHAPKRAPRPLLPWDAYLRQVGPAALSTALDVGLSNWSFLYITVSLYTMTKSSAVLFILFFSLVFRLEEPVRDASLWMTLQRERSASGHAIYWARGLKRLWPCITIDTEPP
nr:solute carrier family 35 member C2-like [Anolis sagrei ordinatus]